MKKVLITGAVEGLGRALADQVLAQGDFVLAVDHNRQGLHDLTQSHVGQCDSRMVDMADLGAVRILGEGTDSNKYDLVILNAGISATGLFEEIPMSAYERLIAINLRAPLILASSLVRSGKMAKGSKIVFVSSLSNAVGYPGASVYAATKDGIATYAQSVRKPFRRKGVGVLTVFPGPIRTAHAEKHAPSGVKANKRMAPQKLANMILKAASRKDKVLYPGFGAGMASMFGNMAPNLATKMMRRVIFDKLDKPEF